tara:strand:- start:550 stop:834 length:285 start_codon:yes stop_codon:yes gene_type:complete
MKNLDTYLQEVIDNIRSDREITKELLEDVFKYLSKNESHHREVGPVAAKYVETLQRSNEQLVKVSSLIQKRDAQSQDISIDREQIFDLIKESKD